MDLLNFMLGPTRFHVDLCKCKLRQKSKTKNKKQKQKNKSKNVYHHDKFRPISILQEKNTNFDRFNTTFQTYHRTSLV